MREILKHNLEIIDINNFKEYLEENENKFNGFSLKAFLKAIDIPPSYFLEQPEETQQELLENKASRIESLKKYKNKCLVILWKDEEIMNCCRMDATVAEVLIDKLSTIEDVENIIWSNDFYKDGYLQGYIPVYTDIEKTKYNRCLVVDFPILLNKPVRIHDGFFKLPQEDDILDTNYFYYNSSSEVDMDDYQHVALAIQDAIQATEETGWTSIDNIEDTKILREPEEVSCMLAEEKVIPKNLIAPIAKFLADKLEFETGVLTVKNTTESILKYEGNLKSIKQVTNIRGCYSYLSDAFARENAEKVETLA